MSKMLIIEKALINTVRKLHNTMMMIIMTCLYYASTTKQTNSAAVWSKKGEAKTLNLGIIIQSLISTKIESLEKSGDFVVHRRSVDEPTSTPMSLGTKPRTALKPGGDFDWLNPVGQRTHSAPSSTYFRALFRPPLHPQRQVKFADGFSTNSSVLRLYYDELDGIPFASLLFHPSNPRKPLRFPLPLHVRTPTKPFRDNQRPVSSAV